MDKRADPLFLVILKNKSPQTTEGNHADKKDCDQMFLRYARDKYHAKPDQKNNDGGTEIRLKENQYKKTKSVKTGNQDMPNICNFYMSPTKIFCQKHNQNQFYKIHRLEGETAKIKPASCPFGRPHSKKQEKDKAGSQESGDNNTRTAQKPPINHTCQKQSKERDDDPDNLSIEKVALFHKRIHGYHAGKSDKNKRSHNQPIDRFYYFSNNSRHIRHHTTTLIENFVCNLYTGRHFFANVGRDIFVYLQKISSSRRKEVILFRRGNLFQKRFVYAIAKSDSVNKNSVSFGRSRFSKRSFFGIKNVVFFCFTHWISRVSGFPIGK